MKKISLKNLKEVDLLSREQLKNVLGGFTDGTGTDDGLTTTENVEKKCSGPCTKNVEGVERSGTYQKKTDGTCICAVIY